MRKRNGEDFKPMEEKEVFGVFFIVRERRERDGGVLKLVMEGGLNLGGDTMWVSLFCVVISIFLDG